MVFKCQPAPPYNTDSANLSTIGQINADAEARIAEAKAEASAKVAEAKAAAAAEVERAAIADDDLRSKIKADTEVGDKVWRV